MCRDASIGRSLSAATKDDATCPETPWYKQRNFYVCLVIVGVLSSETMIRMAQVSQSSSPSSPDSVLEINQVTGLETDHDPKPAFGFYVFGDVPYATWEERMLQDQMDDLTKHRLNHTLFSVHVGDLQRTLVSHCNEEYYHMVRQILRRGPLPTFVVAGDNDWYGALPWIFRFTQSRLDITQTPVLTQSLTLTLHPLHATRLFRPQARLGIIW